MARHEARAAYAFLTPTVLLFIIFILGPLLGGVVLSFFQWDLFSDPIYVGLKNFRRIPHDPTVRASVLNTLEFSFWSILIHVGSGLILALAVNQVRNRGITYFLRTAFFFPMLISWAAASLIWLYIGDPNFGFITYYLQKQGLPAPLFLIDNAWAMPSVIFVDSWKTIGFTFIILLTGLQSIPTHLYEAASIDGAGHWRRFLNVTLPMLSPTLFFSLVITFIGAFQIFEPMYIMTAGGPGDKTISIVMYIYETGFHGFEMGYSAALALLVFVVILAVTLVQLLMSRLWVFHE